MAVPKRRKSHSRVRTQRAHKAMKPVEYTTCSSCGGAMLPHRVCPTCGKLRGRDYSKAEDT